MDSVCDTSGFLEAIGDMHALLGVGFVRGPEASDLRQQDMEYDGKGADKSACIDGK